MAEVNSQTLSYTQELRTILCRFVFAFIFCCLVYYFLSNTLVHQLQAPVLVFPYVDLTYWLFHIVKLPELVTQHLLLAWIFDSMLFLTCLLAFFFPSRRIYAWAFFCLYFLYYIVFSSYGTQHTHSKVGILLAPLPFMLPKKMFGYLWACLRYFTLFVYADAFAWKLLRWEFLMPEHGSLVVKKNWVAFLYQHPTGYVSSFYHWLLANPLITQSLFVVGLCMEGAFIIGFFTKRYDKLLLVYSVLLPVGFLIFSDAFFFELLVLSFTLMAPGNRLPVEERLVQ